MGLCKTSIFSIFTFISASDLKFCPHSYSSCVYHMMRFKGQNGKVCKMMTSHFGTLFICPQTQLNPSSYRDQYTIAVAMRPQYYNDVRRQPRIQPISGSYPCKLGKSRNLQENISGLEPILTSENIASYKLRMQLISPKFKQVASLDRGVMLHKF